MVSFYNTCHAKNNMVPFYNNIDENGTILQYLSSKNNMVPFYNNIDENINDNNNGTVLQYLSC